MATTFKVDLQPHYEVIAELLSKKMSAAEYNKSRLIANKWDRQIFSQFCSLMRMRNKDYFSWWSVINTAAFHGKPTNSIPSYFGITILKGSLATKLNGFMKASDVMMKGRTTLLASGLFGVCAIDNTQIMTPRKFQRQGVSSMMNMYTTRLFFYVINPENLDLYLWPLDTVPITYMDQAIPPPKGMPLYHLCGAITVSNFEQKSLPEYASFSDYTGACVKSYTQRFRLSQTISSLRKLIPHHTWEGTAKAFKFQYEDQMTTIHSLNIPKSLDPNRRPLGENKGALSHYKSMHEFPRQATVIWRGETPKAAILVQPLSKMDETTNKGAGIVLITQLIMFGILKPLSHDGTQCDPKHLELEEGWEARTLMFVGDGLTMARIKSFDDILNSSSMEYTMKHEKAIILRKALTRVVMITGDLHGCFHCLSPVYSIFYGAMIQPIQAVLKWKRIQGSDITKCYQQANGLASMISEEIERHLIVHCYSELSNDQSNLTEWNNVKSDPKKAALFLANHYLDWIETKRASTTDDVFRMCLNFVTMMTNFKNMVMAVRSGDSIMIEAMYINMLPIFEAAGKKNYVEITCTQIENLYSNLDPKTLQRVRMNRTFPLYTGRNSRGELMAHKAIDDHVENQQPGYSTLGTNPEHKDTFCESSIHVTLYKKASQFANIHYYRNETGTRRRNQEYDEVTFNRDGSMPPKRKAEHHAIAEFLQIVHFTTEIPGRKYSRKDVWDGLAKTTVKIKEGKEKEVRKLMMKEGEFDVDGFAEAMYENVNGLGVRNEDDSGINVEVELPDEFYGNDTNDDEEDGEVTAASIASGNRADKSEVDIATGKRTKIRIRRAAVNELAFKDVVAEGRKMLEKKNLAVLRYRMFLREKRKRAFEDSVYEEVKKYSNGGEESIDDEIELRKLKRMRVSVRNES
jgi:hypothetical protein